MKADSAQQEIDQLCLHPEETKLSFPYTSMLGLVNETMAPSSDKQDLWCDWPLLVRQGRQKVSHKASEQHSSYSPHVQWGKWWQASGFPSCTDCLREKAGIVCEFANDAFHFDCPSGQLEHCLSALQPHGTLGKVRCTVPQVRDILVCSLGAKANLHPAGTVHYLANT